MAKLEWEAASGGGYIRAVTVCKTSDLQLPHTHEQELGIGDARPSLFSYATIFELLCCFYGLRRLIVDYLLRGLKPGQFWDLQQASKARGEPNGWECQLIGQWPHNLQETLLRLGRRSCRAERQTLLILESDSPISQVIAYLVREDDDCFSSSPLQQAVAQLIEQFKAPFPAHIPVLFNLNLTVQERAHSLARFQDWWGMFHQGDCCSDYEQSPDETVWLCHPGEVAEKERLAVKLLNQLFELADRGVEPDRCRLLIGCGRIANAVPVSSDPHILVRDLWAWLGSLPSAVLARMVEESERVTVADPP
uniref:hypothetical protein n=1 Tax=Cupriavidus taiwanensis TaxID=164546 RepID=UPI001F1197C8|nr:hypothetical protein [Cupriavidus taiwanensis]